MRALVSVIAVVIALAAGCGTPPVPEPPPPLPPAEEAPAPNAEPDTAVTLRPARPPGPPDTGPLVLDGTPAIPDSLKSRLRQYLSTRGASVGDVRADGKQLIITTQFGETAQVHLLQAPLGARTQLTFADEPARQPVFVPGTGHIAYMADVGGNEKHQLFRLDPSSGTTVRLTDGNSRNGNAVFSRDGTRMAFYSNRRNGRDFDVWVSDGKTAESARLLVQGKGWWAPLEWSRDGGSLLVEEYISINESRLHVAEAASGKVTRLTPESPPAAYRNAVWAADGKRIYVASDRDGEFVELFEVTVPAAGTTSTWRPLTRDIKWNVEGLALAPDGRTLAFTTNEGGISALHLLDTRTRKHRRAPGIPRGLVSGLKFAARANALAMTINTATSASDAHVYDVRRKRLTRWTESEIGGLNPSTFVEPELIEFKSFDDRKIPAFYYRPKGTGPFPVLINIHGGPESQSRPRFSAFTQYLLAEESIAVVVPNVRGSDGYGKTYLRLDNGMKREDSVKDIGALLDWIAARPELDAKRVGVVGGSYGGYMVLASLVHYGDRIVAGADVVGISNFVTFLENTADYRRDLRRAEYGDERDPAMRAHLERISPLNHVDKIRSALFVAQGANDPRVPASEAEQIVKAVRQAGHDCWYMLAKNEGHGFRKKENRDTYLQLATLFFARHLKGSGS